MGRRRQPAIAETLLDACTDHALAHGLPDGLAAFARATGTSTRMLIYHFDTRDRLLTAVLHRARQRQQALFGGLLSPRDEESYLVTLRRAWSAMTGPQGRPYLSMFGQLREDRAQRLWPDFPRRATTDWLGPLAEGMATLGREQLATLVLAVVRGLIIDLEATEDADRVDAAFDDFVNALQGGPRT